MEQESHCTWLEGIMTSIWLSTGHAKMRTRGLNEQVYTFPHLGTHYASSNYWGRGHKGRISDSCHLVIPPCWIKSQPPRASHSWLLSSCPPHTMRCTSIWLINHSLLSSYSSWFFCCACGSVLLIDTVPKNRRASRTLQLLVTSRLCEWGKKKVIMVFYWW
jgi:hypothetical protein